MRFVPPPLGLVAGLVALLASALTQLLAEGRLRVGTVVSTGLSVGTAVAAAETLLQGRPGRAWVGRLSAVRRQPTMPRRGPRPALRQLLRVLPVEQSWVQDGVELTALSLEVYTDGFLVHTRLLRAEPRPLTPESRSLPELVLHATDERGGQYDSWPSGGSGDGQQWRFAHAFVPALDPAVRELRLEVPEIQWRSLGQDELPRVQPGPWRFVVALQGENREGR